LRAGELLLLTHADIDLDTGTLRIPAAVATTTFTKVEKSLTSLGFFTPSSRRLKDQKVKRISFTREVDLTANSTNRGWCHSHRIWSSASFSAASLQQSSTGPVAWTHRCSPARGEIGIRSPRSAGRFMTR
jgi:hypothetical protein